MLARADVLEVMTDDTAATTTTGKLSREDIVRHKEEAEFERRVRVRRYTNPTKSMGAERSAHSFVKTHVDQAQTVSVKIRSDRAK
jgi:hypothetical protein